MNYNTHTLSNGLRIIHLPSTSPVVYCGYQIQAGSRDELPGEEGLAHFCEHTTFKGTSRRRAWHILNSLESVGGDLQAYTTKESTVYYAAILHDHTARAVDLLTDIVFHSTYPQAELDKEVEVICDEIESYNDNPAELIFDEFEELLFKNHPLGRNILGNAARLKTYTTADAVNFTQRFYRPANCTFYVYADAEFARIVKLLEKATSGLDPAPAVKQEAALPPYEAREVVHDKKTHQAHVIVGSRAFSATDKRRTAFFLLNNILGGSGMSSRLNIILREHSALVYTVESYVASYSDTGVWGVYFGCDPKNVARCRKLLVSELARVTSAPLTPSRLSMAKRRLKGQLQLSRDSFNSYAIGMGRAFAKFNRLRDIDAQCRAIDALTAEEVMLAARDVISPDKLTTLIYN